MLSNRMKNGLERSSSFCLRDGLWMRNLRPIIGVVNSKNESIPAIYIL